MTPMQMYADWLDSIKDGPDQTARDRLAQRLVECEQAQTILRARGYGVPGQTIAAMARLVPHARD